MRHIHADPSKVTDFQRQNNPQPQNQQTQAKPDAPSSATSGAKAPTDTARSALPAFGPSVDLDCALTESTTMQSRRAEGERPPRVQMAVIPALLKSSFGSAGTVVFSGVTMLCIGMDQPIATSIFAIVTALGVINRFRDFRRADSPSDDSNAPKSRLFSVLNDQLRSTSIDFRFAFLWHLVAAAEAKFINGTLMYIPAILYATGEVFAARLQDRKAAAARDPLGSDQSPEAGRAGVGSLKNPMAYFGVADILVNAFKVGLSSPGLYPGMFLAGVASAWAVIDGARRSEPSGNAFRVLAPSQLTFCIFHLSTGNFWLAGAFFCWTISPFMQGHDQDQLQKK